MAFRQHGAVGSETDVSTRFLSLKARVQIFPLVGSSAGLGLKEKQVASFHHSCPKPGSVVAAGGSRQRKRGGGFPSPRAGRFGRLGRFGIVLSVLAIAGGHTQLNLVPPVPASISFVGGQMSCSNLIELSD